MRTARLTLAAAGLSVGLALTGGTAMAQQKIGLTIAAGQAPAGVPGLQRVTDTFIPEVNKRLAAAPGPKIEIQWREAYAGSLLQPLQMLDGIKDGIAEIGFTPTIFYPDKLPLEQLSYVAPFSTNSVATMTRIMNKLHDMFPEFPAQYVRFNQVRLAGSGADSFQLLTTFPVKSVDDIKGRKIGTAGAALSWLRGTGAVPVQSNMMEYYNSTKTGVFEGFIVFGSSIPGFKYPEVAPYVTRVDFGAQYAVVLAMNREAYNRLPDAVRKAILEGAHEWAMAADKTQEAGAARAFQMVTELKGQAVEFPREEQAKWARAMPNLAKDWAADMDRRGLPGTKALVAFMNELRASGITPIRDWDKE